MQNPMSYAPCPNCGATNAQKVNFTWWGGVLGPRLMTHVKCQNCNTEYNGKTGKSNQQNIMLYFGVGLILAFCICFALAAMAFVLGAQ